jgi:hypothetical protein
MAIAQNTNKIYNSLSNFKEIRIEKSAAAFERFLFPVEFSCPCLCAENRQRLRRNGGPYRSGDGD